MNFFCIDQGIMGSGFGMSTFFKFCVVCVCVCVCVLRCLTYFIFRNPHSSSTNPTIPHPRTLTFKQHTGTFLYQVLQALHA